MAGKVASRCPSCRETILVAEALTGKRTNCPKCGASFIAGGLKKL